MPLLRSSVAPVIPVLEAHPAWVRLNRVARRWTAALLHTHQFETTETLESEAFGEPVRAEIRRCACGSVSPAVIRD